MNTFNSHANSSFCHEGREALQIHVKRHRAARAKRTLRNCAFGVSAHEGPKGAGMPKRKARSETGACEFFFFFDMKDEPMNEKDDMSTSQMYNHEQIIACAQASAESIFEHMEAMHVLLPEFKGDYRLQAAIIASMTGRIEKTFMPARD